MAKKICLVTGGTSGIGLASAHGLANMGHITIIVGRNCQKCDRICQKIKSENNNAQVEYLVADLSSQKEIQDLADQFKARYKRLDVLVNNAGAKFLKRHVTEDGIEMTLALNHLAYFLLTHLLMDQLTVSTDARIVNVSSGAHKDADIDFNDIQSKQSYIGKTAYGKSKLMNLMFTYEMARRLSGSNVTVNAVEPGGVITNFCRNNGWLSWGKHVLAHILARNLVGPKKPAATIIYLATSSDLRGVSGSYYFDKQPIKSSAVSYDTDKAVQLWDISTQLVKQPLK